MCPSRFTWRPKIFDVHWHHIVITVDGCNSARLFVDGKEIISIAQTKDDWPLHNTNMTLRVVVGGRWLGKEKRYDEFFEGYLAGLSVNSGETITEKVHNLVKITSRPKPFVDHRDNPGLKINPLF